LISSVLIKQESALVNQGLMRQDLALIREDLQKRPGIFLEDLILFQYPPPTYERKPKSTMLASTRKKWLVNPGLLLLYWKTAKSLQPYRRRYSLFFGATLPGSKVLLAHLSPTLGFQIHVRNIIPADASIVQACKTGDVHLVQELLRQGKAKPNDLTEHNLSLMTVRVP
jgi:hypothetical protein